MTADQASTENTGPSVTISGIMYVQAKTLALKFLAMDTAEKITNEKARNAALVTARREFHTAVAELKKTAYDANPQLVGKMRAEAAIRDVLNELFAEAMKDSNVSPIPKPFSVTTVK